MNKFYEKLTKNLGEEINELTIKYSDTISLSEAVISLILNSLSLLKGFVIKNGFTSIREEIYFFKCQKPSIVAKLIYYNTIYKIEIKKPNDAEAIKKYLKIELKKLKSFFDENLEFYKYYRTNNTVLDEKLFVRGNHDIKLGLDTNYFQSDLSFSTSHDYKVAKILANDLIRIYIEDQLNKAAFTDELMESHKLRWTSSKSALTELIYALHTYGVFDNGNSDIRLIAKYFETAFNIHLGDFYHTYMELKARKINRTKFLDGLRESLIRKMEEQDDR